MRWSEILQLLLESNSFVNNAFISVILLSPLAAIVGVLITVRRMASVSSSLSHALLLGVGLSFFLRSRDMSVWFEPFWAALIVSLLFMLLLGLIDERSQQRHDVNTNLIWAAGMSGGLLFIKLTPGYVDLLSYLFGNLLLLQQRDLIMLLLLNGAAFALVIFQGRALRLLSFDRGFAISRGLKPYWQQLPFNLLCALSIATLSVSIGQLLVLAILTIPAAGALLFCRSMVQAMLFAFFLLLVSSLSGLILSLIWNLPSASLTILLMVALHLLLLVIKRN